MFENPLVPIGVNPIPAENADSAAGTPRIRKALRP
jgi:hypothetical protein